MTVLIFCSNEMCGRKKKLGGVTEREKEGHERRNLEKEAIERDGDMIIDKKKRQERDMALEILWRSGDQGQFRSRNEYIPFRRDELKNAE